MSAADHYDLIVIGGGAAGVFSAIHAAAAAPDKNVLILEKSNHLLAKVRISGGGRCNVTNALEPVDAFARQYPRGSKHMRVLLHRFSKDDTISWFEKNGVPLKTEKDLRVFPQSDSSESIISCLKQQLEMSGIKIRFQQLVRRVQPAAGGFLIKTDQTDLHCSKLIIACGGLPAPASYQWQQPLGLQINNPVPSLFTFNIPTHPAKHLMGLSAVCRVRIEGSKLEETGPLLITHWGFSGPAVLRLSAWGARLLAKENYRFTIRIHWLPEMGQDSIRELLQRTRETTARKHVSSRLFGSLPDRLWEYLCGRAEITADIRWADLSNQKLNKLCEVISADQYLVSGKTTFKEEFVTCGGIALEEIDSHTCMAKKHPGLFFAGEILDVDGITGGFNFQHAWASGFVAGSAVWDAD
jgi:predicted Rossmann fold flavoprotein